LMSKRYRDEECSTLNNGFEQRTSISSLDREMDWNEIAIITRAGQARALGLAAQGKGHLAPGAEADLAIYPIRCHDVDPATEYRKVVEGFQKTRFTIKRGRVVARDGDVIVEGANTTFWVNPIVPDEHNVANDPEFVKKFEEYYTVRMSNYPVQDVYLPRGRCIKTEADL
jgi:formylmethanofuran dehydrogenase subunit A